MEAEEPKSR
jgi:hypothetical protein